MPKTKKTTRNSKNNGSKQYDKNMNIESYKVKGDGQVPLRFRGELILEYEWERAPRPGEKPDYFGVISIFRTAAGKVVLHSCSWNNYGNIPNNAHYEIFVDMIKLGDYLVEHEPRHASYICLKLGIVKNI